MEKVVKGSWFRRPSKNTQVWENHLVNLPFTNKQQKSSRPFHEATFTIQLQVPSQWGPLLNCHYERSPQRHRMGIIYIFHHSLGIFHVQNVFHKRLLDGRIHDGFFPVSPIFSAREENLRVIKLNMVEGRTPHHHRTAGFMNSVKDKRINYHINWWKQDSWTIRSGSLLWLLWFLGEQHKNHRAKRLVRCVVPCWRPQRFHGSIQKTLYPPKKRIIWNMETDLF